MAEYTPNLDLLKKNPAVDGNDTFNIKTMLNDNWDKIDFFCRVLGEILEEGLGDVDDVELAVSNLIEQVGNLEEVNTETKLSLVAAINEVYRNFIEHKAENVKHLSYAIATGTNSYAVNIPEITSLVEGMSVKINFTSANTGACTLNINDLSAIPIKKSNGNDLSAGNIKAGQICHLVYTGTVFQLLGEGGEYGTAQANHVLSPYTIGTEEGIIEGTMPNRGAINNTITTQNGQFNIPEGYTDGGVVKAQFTNLIASNIKKGVNIGGIVGNMPTEPRLIKKQYKLEVSKGTKTETWVSDIVGPTIYRRTSLIPMSRGETYVINDDSEWTAKITFTKSGSIEAYIRHSSSASGAAMSGTFIYMKY